jgi:hypothetical protein
MINSRAVSTAHFHVNNYKIMLYNHSTVARYQAMTIDQREAAVAAHVEALHSLGWRWEGRGLVPTIQTGWIADPISANLCEISLSSTDNGNHSPSVGVTASNTVELIQ